MTDNWCRSASFSATAELNYFEYEIQEGLIVLMLFTLAFGAFLLTSTVDFGKPNRCRQRIKPVANFFPEKRLKMVIYQSCREKSTKKSKEDMCEGEIR